MFAILVAHVSIQMPFYDCIYYYIFKVHFPRELSDLERILEYFGDGLSPLRSDGGGVTQLHQWGGGVAASGCETPKGQFASYGKLFWGESVACSSFLGSAWLGVSTVFLTVQIGSNWHKLAPAGLRSPFSRKSCGCRMLQTRESMIMYCYHTLFY